MLLIPYKDFRESEEQVKEWMGKGMVEREEQVKIGIKSGALKKDEYICVDRLMNRICAPNSHECHSIILWTKKSADDKDKKWDKVVCSTPDSNTTKSDNLCQYSLEAWSMVWTLWKRSFIMTMIPSKGKWRLCKLALSMHPSAANYSH